MNETELVKIIQAKNGQHDGHQEEYEIKWVPIGYF